MREHETRKVCVGLSHELLINASSVMPRPTYRLLQKTSHGHKRHYRKRERTEWSRVL